MSITCPICSRDVPEYYQEQHHIVPKAKGGREKTSVCCDCGDIVHQLFTNSQLKRELNTLDKIIAHPRIQTWVRWISKRPDQFGFCMRRKKKR